MTSIFKSNKFFRIIKHFILALPLMFILGTSIYTIVNPNAKDSYYGETVNSYEYDFLNAFTDLREGKEYYFSNPLLTLTGTNSRIDTNLNVSNFTLFSTLSDLNGIDIYRITFYIYNNTNPLVRFNSNASLTYSLHDIMLEFKCTFLNGDNLNKNESLCKFYSIEYNEYSYLNNSFAFGMYQFNQIGFNKFDFVGLFDGIFTDNIHNVYTDFINSYINYYLMIECVYFVPWVIHIFIHFAYDLGDYFTSSFKRNRKEDD